MKFAKYFEMAHPQNQIPAKISKLGGCSDPCNLISAKFNPIKVVLSDWSKTPSV